MEDLQETLKSIKEYIFKKPTKEQLELRRKNLALLRQRQIEQFEINQTWSIIYGLKKPKNKNEIKEINNITYRNIWMEENYLYNKIIELQTNERFHDINSYILQWKPPGSLFYFIIPLNNKEIQANTIKQLKYYTKRQLSSIYFYLTTINKNLPLYAPNINKVAFESYTTRPSVLNKLCEKYMEGVLPINDLSNILEAGYSTWKMALYNVLDQDEQQYHRYLMKPPIKEIKKSIERQYLDEEITLQQYNDLKFPERKKKIDEENLSYPLPYQTNKCIICEEENKGVIRCLHCSNLVCIQCIKDYFLSDNNAIGSFLILHRKYCLKLGILKEIKVEITPIPTYLKILKSTGQTETLKDLNEFNKSKFTLNENDENELNDVLQNNIGRKKNLEVSNDVGDEDDPSDDPFNFLGTSNSSINSKVMQNDLILYSRIIDKLLPKIENEMKNLKEFQAIIDNPNRSSHLQERIKRIRSHRIETKIQNKLQKKIELLNRIVIKKKYDQIKEFNVKFEELIKANDRLNRLIQCESLIQFDEQEQKLIEIQILNSKSQLLLKLTK